MTRKTFADGDRWMAADAQLVMDQGVLVFADAAQRDAQVPAPTVGMVAWLTSTSSLYVYQAGAWTEVLSAQGASSLPSWPAAATVLGADTTAPSLGNATVAGYYAKAGAAHVATLRILFGSTSTFGSGTWTVGLPRAAGGASFTMGHGYIVLSSSAQAPLPVILLRQTSTACRMIRTSDGSFVGSALAWAQGGSVNLTMMYV